MRNLEHRTYIDLTAKRKSSDLECNTHTCVHPSYDTPSKSGSVITNTVEVKDVTYDVDSNTVNQISKEESAENGSGIIKDTPGISINTNATDCSSGEIVNDFLPDISRCQRDKAECQKETNSSPTSKVLACEIEAKDLKMGITEGCKDADNSAVGDNKHTGKGEPKGVQTKPDDNGTSSETGNSKLNVQPLDSYHFM